MKHCLTSAEARDRADDAARAAHEVLRAPGVRLTLTVGVIFCMLATVAALTIPEAAAFVATLLSGGDGLPAWVTPVSCAVLLFTVSPM